jgi:hypothetical protein
VQLLLELVDRPALPARDREAEIADAGFEACVDRLYPSTARPAERSDGAAVQAVRG